MNTLQIIAFILVYLGLFLNSQENTKLVSYLLWICSNAILAIIATSANLPIITLMYIGMIIVLIVNILKSETNIIKLLQNDSYESYRIIQEYNGSKKIYTLETTYIFMGKRIRSWSAVKTIDGLVIKFDTLEEAVGFKDEHSVKGKKNKQIVG